MQKKYFFAASLMAAFVLFAVSCQKSEQTRTVSSAGGADMRIVIVPKVVHPWFDDFANYARLQAEELGNQIGRKITIDYRAPTTADVAEQNSIIQQAAATKPTG
ncbi:MAG: hypothetical protein LBB47_05335, partial [Spirochaetaceae bacterium]|nr:hypothetical protein [Spirochaetaceae bacterium]